MSNPTLLILAAGQGSRYGSSKITDSVGPNGEIVMDYSIYDALRAGFDRVVIVVRREMEEVFRQMAVAHLGKHVNVELVHQDLTKIQSRFQVPMLRTKPWGTTHAILCAARLIHEPFAVINVDDFYGTGSYELLGRHLRCGGNDFAMMGYVLRETLSEFGAVARGVCKIGKDDLLESITELKRIEYDDGRAVSVDAEGKETRLPGDAVVSMNMWGFTPRIFPLLAAHFERFLEGIDGNLEAECFIPTTVNEILRAGEARVKVLQSGESWFGVTYREDHLRAVQKIRALISAGYYPKRLWSAKGIESATRTLHETHAGH